MTSSYLPISCHLVDEIVNTYYTVTIGAQEAAVHILLFLRAVGRKPRSLFRIAEQAIFAAVQCLASELESLLHNVCSFHPCLLSFGYAF